MRSHAVLAPICTLLCLARVSPGDTIHVPGDAPSIPAAIALASDGDEILVAPGTYEVTLNYLGKAIAIRSTGGPDVTIIDGAELPDATLVAMVSGEGPGTLLEGFSIVNASGDNGAGVLVSGSFATVRGCVFRNNHVSGFYSSVSIIDADAVVEGCTFEGNSASFGGGMNANINLGSVVVRDCRFTQNEASFGGGLHIDTGQEVAGATATTTIERCVFESNLASHGGGLWVSCTNASVADIDACEFRENSGQGAGARLNAGSGSTITIANSLFDENLGRGVQSSSSGGTVTLVNSTVARNALGISEGGSGLVRSNLFLLHNSIVHDHTGVEILEGQVPVSVRSSIVQGGHPGIAVLDVDPQFADPDADDLSLSPGSPAIDAADNTLVPPGATVDLGGAPRFVDDPDTTDTGVGPAPIADMGAYEFAPACPADLTGDGEVDSLDFFAFLDLFAAGDERADLAPPEGLGSEDFFAYLDLFVAGCP